MELKESKPATLEAGKSSEAKKWTEESARHQALILNFKHYWYSIYDVETRIIFENSKKELKKMGEGGVDLVSQAVENYELDPYKAFLLLKEINHPKAFTARESLLVSEAILQRPNACGIAQNLIEDLTKKDQSSSVPIINQFAEKVLKKVNQDLETPESFPDYLYGRLPQEMEDVKLAIESLQNFTDRKGYESAVKLHESYNQTFSKIEELRKSQPDRLNPLLTEPYKVNLENFPGVAPEEVEKINSLINQIQSRGVDYPGIDAIRNFGEGAIPIIYQSIKDGKLTGYNALFTLRQAFPSDKMLPIYYGLLLDASETSSFFQGDILQIIEASRNPESIKIVSEFMRRVAEGALKVNGDETRLALATHFNNGLKALEVLRTKEALELAGLLKSTYPEIIMNYYNSFVGYKLTTKFPNIPTLEKPETKLRREWKHTKMFIRGSAIFAEMLGKGKEKVRDVDVFVTYPSHMAAGESMRVGSFENIDQIEHLLPPEEFQKLKVWLEATGYIGKKINLVRIPELHLSVEQTFDNEPKLVLWDNEIEEAKDRFTVAYPENADLYQQGKLYLSKNDIPGKSFPEKLVANGTLARALRVLDLAERFGFEYDSTLLDQAEKVARNGELLISATPINRLDHSEANGMTVMDATFIKVFADKNLRKLLLKKYPRLGQLAEGIVSTGGVEDYIRQNFGEVYLQARGFVRQYDINLSKSPATAERQKQFIHEWYSELKQKDFTFVRYEKTSEEANLPKPESLDSLTDKKLLAKALEKRKVKTNPLEKAAGTYKIFLESTDPFELKKKIDSFLAVMNLEWPAAADKDKKRVSTTLIKLGVHPRNPILSQFDSSKAQEAELVISGNAQDILQASLDKPWISCMELGGGAYYRSLYEDIGGGTFIAYIIRGKNFIARSLVRPGRTMENFDLAAAIERGYGDQRYYKSMRKAISEILLSLRVTTGKPMITHAYGPEIYSGSAKSKTETYNLIYD